MQSCAAPHRTAPPRTTSRHAQDWGQVEHSQIWVRGERGVSTNWCYGGGVVVKHRTTRAERGSLGRVPPSSLPSIARPPLPIVPPSLAPQAPPDPTPRVSRLGARLPTRPGRARRRAAPLAPSCNSCTRHDLRDLAQNPPSMLDACSTRATLCVRNSRNGAGPYTGTIGAQNASN